MITETNILDAEVKIIEILKQRNYASDKDERIRIANYLFGILNNELGIK